MALGRLNQKVDAVDAFVPLAAIMASSTRRGGASASDFGFSISGFNGCRCQFFSGATP